MNGRLDGYKTVLNFIGSRPQLKGNRCYRRGDTVGGDNNPTAKHHAIVQGGDDYPGAQGIALRQPGHGESEAALLRDPNTYSNYGNSP